MNIAQVTGWTKSTAGPAGPARLIIRYTEYLWKSFSRRGVRGGELVKTDHEVLASTKTAHPVGELIRLFPRGEAVGYQVEDDQLVVNG